MVRVLMHVPLTRPVACHKHRTAWEVAKDLLHQGYEGRIALEIEALVLSLEHL